MRRFIIAAIAAMAVLTSCNNEFDSILYRCTTMGFVRYDGALKGDDGRIYIVDDPRWTSGDRVYAIMDVRSSENDSTYRADLLFQTRPLYKAPIVLDGKPAPDTLGTDGINIVSIWYSGGCLNMQNMVTDYREAGGRHVVNLTADGPKAKGDTLHLTLYHRADYPAEPFGNATDATFFCSFPIKDLLPDEGAYIEVNWKWENELKKVASPQ